jgi:predicted RNase H-like HicB family nuclease
MERHYLAVAEASGDGHGWWISFPGIPGVVTAANSPGQITRQARDALASATEAGAILPPAVEDAGIPLYDLAGFRDPLVLMIGYDQADK